MEAIEHLSGTEWAHPECYTGFSPNGDYLIYTQNRDSTILENCNYTLILDQLKKLSKTIETDNDKPFAYDFRAGHWGCGWVEYILIRKDSPDKLKQLAGEFICTLSDYPILDECKYTELQCDAVSKYWDDCALSEKIEWCKESNLSCFAARGGYPESLEESEMFY